MDQDVIKLLNRLDRLVGALGELEACPELRPTDPEVAEAQMQAIRREIKDVQTKINQLDPGRALYMVIGQRVKAWRIRRNMGQVELAQAMGWSRTSITNLEVGNQHPPIHKLYQLAAILDVDVGALLPGRWEVEDPIVEKTEDSGV